MAVISTRGLLSNRAVSVCANAHAHDADAQVLLIEECCCCSFRPDGTS